VKSRLRQWLAALSGRHSGRPSAGKRANRLRIEMLEDRFAPAVFNVNSLADVMSPAPGVVTLRSAIQQANQTPGNNTINLTVAGTYKIALPGAGEDNNATGDFDIILNAASATGSSLTIENTSHGKVVVDGNHLDRVFDINPNDVVAPAKYTVVLQGFTIQNGVAQPGDGAAGSGGGIRDQGNVSLTLTNMTVINNLATADGGGVGMENGASTPWALTINNSTIANNRAGDAGGGVETDGSGKVVINPGTVISGNTSVNQGAGIWPDAIQVGNVFQSASLNVSGTFIGHNKALSAGGGGGIGNAGNGLVTILNSTLADNFAGATGGGFGDENAQGSLVVLNSTFLDNTATGNGGGIAAGGPVTSIANTEIDGNTSGGLGGGLFANGVKLTVQNTTLTDNTASGNGGGIELETTGAGLFQGSTITNTTVTGNTALNNAGANGGGIDADSGFTGDLLLLNDTMNANFASVGGGIFWAATAGSNFGLQNTIVAGNFAAVGPDAASNLLFTAALSGGQQVPPVNSPAAGTATAVLCADQTTLTFSTAFANLQGTPTEIHLHNAPAGQNGPVATDANGANIELGNLPQTTSGTAGPQTFTVNAAVVAQLLQGNIYGNIHTTAFPTGEIRGQLALTNGAFLDLGGNLIGVTGPGGGNTGFTSPLTQTGPSAVPLDPLLGPLQSNGGPTIGAPGHTMTLQTEMLTKGSPAIGKGLLFGAPLSDARGPPSVVNGAANAGATGS
jgi:parallel beta-helix repeat protein/predicted outer membrane repeat protein